MKNNRNQRKHKKNIEKPMKNKENQRKHKKIIWKIRKTMGKPRKTIEKPMENKENEWIHGPNSLGGGTGGPWPSGPWRNPLRGREEGGGLETLDPGTYIYIYIPPSGVPPPLLLPFPKGSSPTPSPPKVPPPCGWVGFLGFSLVFQWFFYDLLKIHWFSICLLMIF